MTQLFKDDGTGNLEAAGVHDLCEWWIEFYPEDLFVNEPKEVIEIRKLMQKILAMRKDVTN